MKEDSLKNDAVIIGQMLSKLSEEYPVISKKLSKKFNNKNTPNKNQRKYLKAIDLYKQHPSVFERISALLGASSNDKYDSPRYAQVDWDNQELRYELYSGSYGSKYEDSIKAQNSEFDSIFNSY